MFFFSFFCFFLLTPSIVLPGMASYGSNAGQKQAERGKRDTEREEEKKRTFFSSFVLFFFYFFYYLLFFLSFCFFLLTPSLVPPGTASYGCRAGQKEAEKEKRDINRGQKKEFNFSPFLCPISFYFFLLSPFFFTSFCFFSRYSVSSSTRHGVLRLPCRTKGGRKREKGHREKE